MKIKNVDLLLTFECPSMCRHCSYKAGPERIGRMELEDARRHLEELVEAQPLRSLTAHGGEPFLCFSNLKLIMKKAKELEIPVRWVITNGYWAKSKRIARRKLTQLKEAGLTCITFSVDSFHQEYISLERVRNGLEAATTVGFEKVSIDGYLLIGSDSNNYYDNLTMKAWEGFEGSDKVKINRYRIGFEGRGADLSKYADPKLEPPNGKCLLPFWIGGTLENPETIEIDFRGNVTLCPGICIGSTEARSLTEIVQNYDCYAHPILSVIAKEGPIGLLKDAISKGFKKHQRFVDECHLCYEMRKFLRPYYPLWLAPAECY